MAVSLGLSGLFFFLGNQAYDNYMEATTVDDVPAYKAQFRKRDLFTYVAGGTDGLGLGFFGVFQLTKPGAKKMEAARVELSIIEAEIGEVQGDLGWEE